VHPRPAHDGEPLHGGGDRYGWGAIQFDNSSNNVITNNTFVAVENTGERRVYPGANTRG
jgi:hypothetical protein